MSAPAAAVDVRRELAERVRSTYAEVLDGATDVALLDYPNHVNIGDAAIWRASWRSCARSACA